MTRLAALLLVAVALGTTLYEAASPSTGLTGAYSAPETSTRPLAAPDGLEQRQVEEAGVPSAPAAGAKPPPGPNPEPLGLGNRAAHRAGSALEPPLAPARPTLIDNSIPSITGTVGICASPCAVDVSEWDIPTPEPVSVNGIASHMGRGFPSWYLALPQGPGFIARICGPGGCVTRTSTDAGPSKAMQRWPYYRVADLSVADFETVCGCSASLGLVPVSVALIGRAR